MSVTHTVNVNQNTTKTNQKINLLNCIDVGNLPFLLLNLWKYAIASFLGPVKFKSMIIMKIHKKCKPCANPAQTLRKYFEPHKHAMHVISPQFMQSKTSLLSNNPSLIPFPSKSKYKASNTVGLGRPSSAVFHLTNWPSASALSWWKCGLCS